MVGICKEGRRCLRLESALVDREIGWQVEDGRPKVISQPPRARAAASTGEVLNSLWMVSLTTKIHQCHTQQNASS